MKALRSLLLGVFGVAILMAVSIAVSIFGWGLQPQSWWWIIGGNLAGHIVGQVIIICAKQDE